MDPIANQEESLSLAKELLTFWDGDNHLTTEDGYLYIEKGARLAELVISLAEWRSKGGHG